MEPPYCCFTLYKEFVYESCVFFDITLQHCMTHVLSGASVDHTL
jgi:hypothetical protein